MTSEPQVHLQALQHPPVRILAACAQSVAVTCTIQLGDKLGATEMFGCLWSAGWLWFLSLTSSAPLVWVLWSYLHVRGDSALPASLPPSPSRREQSTLTAVYSFIFIIIIPLKLTEILRVSEAVWSSSRLNLDVLVHPSWCKLNHYSKTLDRLWWVES